MEDLTLKNFNKGNKFFSEQTITASELQNQSEFYLEIVVRVNLGKTIKDGPDNKLYFIIENNIDFFQFQREILKCLDTNGYELVDPESMIVKFRHKSPKHVYKVEDLDDSFSNGMNLRISAADSALILMENDDDLATAIDKRCLIVYTLPPASVISTQSVIQVNNSANGGQIDSTHKAKRPTKQSTGGRATKKQKKAPENEEMTKDNLNYLLLDVVIPSTKVKSAGTKVKKAEQLKVEVGKVVKKTSDGSIKGDTDKLASFIIDISKGDLLKLSTLRALCLLYLDQAGEHVRAETLTIGMNSKVYLKKNSRVRKVQRVINNTEELNQIIYESELPTDNNNGILTAKLVICFGMMKSDDKCAVTTEYITEQVKRSTSIHNNIPVDHQDKYFENGVVSDCLDSDDDDMPFSQRDSVCSAAVVVSNKQAAADTRTLHHYLGQLLIDLFKNPEESNEFYHGFNENVYFKLQDVISGNNATSVLSWKNENRRFHEGSIPSTVSRVVTQDWENVTWKKRFLSHDPNYKPCRDKYPPTADHPNYPPKITLNTGSNSHLVDCTGVSEDAEINIIKSEANLNFIKALEIKQGTCVANIAFARNQLNVPIKCIPEETLWQHLVRVIKLSQENKVLIECNDNKSEKYLSFTYKVVTKCIDSIDNVIDQHKEYVIDMDSAKSMKMEDIIDSNTLKPVIFYIQEKFFTLNDDDDDYFDL